MRPPDITGGIADLVADGRSVGHEASMRPPDITGGIARGGRGGGSRLSQPGFNEAAGYYRRNQARPDALLVPHQMVASMRPPDITGGITKRARMKRHVRERGLQ